MRRWLGAASADAADQTEDHPAMAEAKKAKPKTTPKPKAQAQGETGPASKQTATPEAKGPAKTKTKTKSPSDPAIYTDPELRDRLKAEITAGDKGGKPGQWSARKAQLLAHEYEKAGGDYKNGKKKKTDAQQHLDSWIEEDWKTADGKPAERDGGMTRYLPAEAWEKLTPAQRKATNAKKQAGSAEGEQFVANTEAAKQARKAASKTDGDKKTSDKPKDNVKTKSAKAERKT